jgi:membrane-associated phospholipid phosphatase
MQEKILTAASKAVSALLLPVVYPTLAVLTVFVTDPYFQALDNYSFWYVISLVFSLTFAGPVLMLATLVFTGAAKSVYLSQQAERTLPLIVAAFFYYLAYILLSKFSAILFINIFILAGSAAMLAALLISYFTKISLHTIGAFGFLAFVLQQIRLFSIDNFVLLCFALLACGAVASSRLYLKAHSPWQVGAGAVLGFSAVILITEIVF